MPAISLSRDEQYALLLSTLAGLSTSIGGAIAVRRCCVACKQVLRTLRALGHPPTCMCCRGAQIIKRPGPALLSFLLGLAIGVMATLSVAEMFIRNALEHGALRVSASVAAGAALYYFVQPFLPDFVEHEHGKKGSDVRRACVHAAGTRQLRGPAPL
jgi:ZIP family zinc transporter